MMNKNWIKKALLAAVFVPCMSMAQKAGDLISGTVYDDLGPMMAVNVVERDAANRVVAGGTTDINGNFSFKIANPKDKLEIRYVGYKTRYIPIKGLVYKIKMEDDTQVLGTVDVVAKKKVNTGGLVIPEREMSVASQTIDAKEFQGLGISTVDEALQGRIAGLDITMNSGNLGAGTSMRLRGVSSINGNANPLIVVNDNVWENDYQSDFDFNNANNEQFAELLNVNPDDILSVSVLKDAAATAIWGSQGANGVISIRTKRGSRGKTKITFSYRFSGTYQPKGSEMLNGDEYTMLMKEAYFNPRLNNAASDIREFNYDPTYSEYQMYNNNTDWRKAVRQFGQEHKYAINLSGGGEKANFYVSGGYDHSKGSVIGQSLDRFTLRSSLDYLVSDRITISTDFALTYTDNNRNYYTGYNAGKSLLQMAYQKMPNLSIYQEDEYGRSTGNYYYMLPTASSQLNDQRSLENPIALAYLAKNEQRSYNIVPEFKLKYRLMGIEDTATQLNYEGKLVFNVSNMYTDRFYPTDLQTDGWNSSLANNAMSESYKGLGITTTHTFTFQPHFKNEDHSAQVLLRGQLTSGSSNGSSLSKYGLPTGSIISPTDPGVFQNMNTSAGKWRSIYITLSAHYAYKGRYIADFTLRRDGSTKFGPDQRWGNFPGASLRWNIVDEKWMKPYEKWLSMLAITGSWGRVGNQPGAEGLFYAKYANGGAYAGQTSIFPSNIRLANLKWEGKETWDGGLNLGFLENMITADLHVYHSKTTDLLMYNRRIPTSSGFSELYVQNNGTMVNNGWEFNIFGNNIVKKGKFSMDVNVTFANNKNQLTEMDPTLLASLNGDFGNGNGTYLSRVQLHNAFGSIYGFRYKGVYQYSDYNATEVVGVSGPNAPVARNADGTVILDENGKTKPMYFAYGTTAAYEFKGGDAMYDDVNHDGNINELDIVYLGSSLPKITGGFGFKLKYGRFTLNNQFNFRLGNKIINQSRMYAENMYGNDNQSKAVNWRWRTEGDVTEIPRALNQYGYNWLGSDRFVENGSFLRLNYTQLNYSVDPKLLSNYGISQLSLYITLNNLFCLTKYSGADPEVGYGSYGVVTDTGNTPRSRSFTIGATLGF